MTTMTRNEIANQISDDIRLAFDLLKEKTNHNNVNLNKAYIITSKYSELNGCTHILGIPVLLVDNDSSYPYSIGIQDPNKDEENWLTFHREALELRPLKE